MSLFLYENSKPPPPLKSGLGQKRTYAIEFHPIILIISDTTLG